MGVLPLGTESHSNWPRKNDLVTKHFESTIKTADVATILCVPWYSILCYVLAACHSFWNISFTVYYTLYGVLVFVIRIR